MHVQHIGGKDGPWLSKQQSGTQAGDLDQTAGGQHRRVAPDIVDLYMSSVTCMPETSRI
jgi:hypothetical protein